MITIATLAPEFPEVETLRIAKNDEEATFASEPYEAFIETLQPVSLTISRKMMECQHMPVMPQV